MARPVTLTQLIARVRRRADLTNDPSVTDADIQDIINGSSWPELYELRIRGYGNEVDIVSATLTATGNQLTLPTRFYQLRKLFVLDNGRAHALKRATDEELAASFGQTGRPTKYFMGPNFIMLLPTPDASYSYTMFYYPGASSLATGTDTIDDVNGWSEFIVVDAAMQLLQREESDVGVLMAQKAALAQRIMQAAANRDVSSPARVSDVLADGDDDLALLGYYA